MKKTFDIVILGLSITSSWGNGHATTWRSLVKGLAAGRRRVLFLERDRPWYAENRDDPQPPGATTALYGSLEELATRYVEDVRDAELVIVGSYVPEGVAVGEWVVSTANGRTAFYDIDTPITLEMLACGKNEYISPALVKQYDAYLSFTGGPILQKLEIDYGARMARALYCSVDEDKYRAENVAMGWDLGYLGTYSFDRQPFIETFLLEPARKCIQSRFVIAGPQYPESSSWPANVMHIPHLAPPTHSAFYSSQRFTLNVTRDAMKAAGYSPSVRLFEAAACGVPIISDWWTGLDTILNPGDEVLVAYSSEDVLRYLSDVPEERRSKIAAAARDRILQAHTSKARAKQLEGYLKEMNDYFSPDSARRDGRNQQCSGRLDPRMAAQ